MSVFVKICGNTNLEDAELAIEYGADALGFIFYEKSKRYVSAKTASEIMAELPQTLLKVGVFVDETPQKIKEILQEVPLDVLQFHGNESVDYCLQFEKPFYKVIHMTKDTQFSQIEKTFHHAQALLLDTKDERHKGGTGQTFNWQWVPSKTSIRLILAGGLTPENVEEAIQIVQPYGVDVVSGVESRAGKKDAAQLKSFITKVKNAKRNQI